jgi:hypothetical protein
MNSTVRIAMMFAAFISPATAQQKPPEKSPDSSACPMHTQLKPASQGQHHEGVVQRGDEVMGFSHEKTTHHFRLYADGGAIEAEVNDAKDTASRDQIRSHFGHIVTMFSAGDFSAPMLIHAQNPPGTEEMKRLRDAIQYKLETTEKGARLHITTKDQDALRAVYEFLRFQIADHQTGDTTEITKAP